MARKLLTPSQRDLLDSMVEMIQGDLGETPEEIQTQLPGMDPITAQTIEQGLQYGQTEIGGARQDAIMQILSGQNPYAMRTQDEIRTQLQDLYLNPAMRAFEQEIAPQIETYYGGTEAYRGGDISRAISEAAEGVGIGAARELAGLTETELGRVFEAGENARQRQLLGLEAAAEEEKTPLRFGLMAGDISRGISTEQANFELMKELRRTPYAHPALGLAPLALGTQAKVPRAGGGGGGIGSILGSLVNPLGSILGGAF